MRPKREGSSGTSSVYHLSFNPPGGSGHGLAGVEHGTTIMGIKDFTGHRVNEHLGKAPITAGDIGLPQAVIALQLMDLCVAGCPQCLLHLFCGIQWGRHRWDGQAASEQDRYGNQMAHGMLLSWGGYPL